ncbi:protein-S-isoprenylcysteine O-methyltransferase-like [Saccoglossus kowalevskii]|uniref:Protein-S-isoprenylcysteine O-methyltransferase n=1 Tax=Saccoglossus kowalevskii TaxID=10224 RepID=A0ABM0GTW2_SACKO|nr:PREDICTED: protein-S-isoprenylcysteine O-methyltransferase-like [Saccoglossus kowalevskii]
MLVTSAAESARSARNVSLVSFSLGLGVLIISLLGERCLGVINALDLQYAVIASVCYLAVVLVLLMFMFRGPSFQIAIRACFLGVVFALGVIVTLLAVSNWTVFGWYLCVLSFFHFSEYVCTSLYNAKSLSLQSFLLDHSLAYHIAAMASWVEYTLQAVLLPGMKQCIWVSGSGLALCIVGEFLRKLAMFTAGKSFNHNIQYRKDESHVLVTQGIYAWCRHPSYVGWFLWSVGTQLILCNPLCFIAYILASWQFFNERIQDEEMLLINFFGEHYIDYQDRVCTGLPFIHGYKMHARC